MPRRNQLRLPLLLLMLGWLAGCSQQPLPPATRPASEANGSPQAGSAVAAEPKAETAAERAELSSSQSEMATHPEAAPATDASHSHNGAAHQDHDAKHGGTFFMALDNKHHLEGVLDPPGVFHVYLYDDHTRPVSRQVLNQAKAKVIWGEQDGAPEIELKPSADGAVLEAPAPGAMQFPVTLTLLVRFPGAPAASRPELFTFPFSHFSHSQPEPHPAGP